MFVCMHVRRALINTLQVLGNFSISLLWNLLQKKNNKKIQTSLRNPCAQLNSTPIQLTQKETRVAPQLFVFSCYSLVADWLCQSTSVVIYSCDWQSCVPIIGQQSHFVYPTVRKGRVVKWPTAMLQPQLSATQHRNTTINYNKNRKKKKKQNSATLTSAVCLLYGEICENTYVLSHARTHSAQQQQKHLFFFISIFSVLFYISAFVLKRVVGTIFMLG